MKSFKYIIPILAIICAIIAIEQSAYAGAIVYSGNRKQINCGIVYLKNTDALNNGGTQRISDSYNSSGATGEVGQLFYLLDSLVGMKPSGWVLENPFATTKRGTTIKYEKRQPEYWYVDLNSARDLSRMQVLYLTAQGRVDLDDDDREKLRRFVDSGGVLWIDNSSSTNPLKFGPTSSPDSFFISDFEFKNSATSGYDYPYVRHHPVITILAYRAGYSYFRR